MTRCNRIKERRQGGEGPRGRPSRFDQLPGRIANRSISTDDVHYGSFHQSPVTVAITGNTGKEIHPRRIPSHASEWQRYTKQVT